MEQMMREIVNEVFHDLEQACNEAGETLDTESLADAIGDRMCDTCEEYRNMPWERRRAMTLRIAGEYV